MKTYIALLRGINVSGHNIINMDALKGALGDLNFSAIRTYIQSGNILFETDRTDTNHLAKMIGETILEHFGCSVPVIIRNQPELEFISKNNPFLRGRLENTENLYVSFLTETPEDTKVKKIMEIKFLPDEFIISGNEIYLFCPDGYGRTKLSNQFFENKLKTTATTRNWKTILKLKQLMEIP